MVLHQYLLEMIIRIPQVQLILMEMIYFIHGIGMMENQVGLGLIALVK